MNSTYHVSLIIKTITKTTTPFQFDETCRKSPHPRYSLDLGNFLGTTALAAAAESGNLDLVDHIVRIGGERLLHIRDICDNTILHYAAECPDPYDSFFVTVRLIVLGAPIAPGDGGTTPLTLALKRNAISLAAVYLRFLTPSAEDLKYERALNEAKKEIEYYEAILSLKIAKY